MSRNPAAKIRLKATGGGFDINVALGSAPIAYTGGATYEEVTRPQLIGMTKYAGNALLHVEVPVLLDGWGPPGDREDQGDRLNKILSICFGARGNPPPSFIASAPTLPFSGTVFKMEGLPDLTDEPKRIYGDNGTLFRQALTLKMIQFVDPADLEFQKTDPSPKVAGGGAIGQAEPVVAEVLKEGETYLGVAARVYGDAGRGPEIMRANGDVSPFKALSKGRRLRLPQAAS